ncbi:MAG: 4Fe-4S dicluster domain-containing protein [Candidatus Bipolaricaulota bacterium]
MARGLVVVDVERCKGCGLCIAACPQHVLALSGTLNQSGYDTVCVAKPESCVGCAFCALTCPDIALAVYREKPSA